jgi:hypothetical protein
MKIMADVADYAYYETNATRDFTILWCDRVTMDGVWIGNWIYWTLTERNYK